MPTPEEALKAARDSYLADEETTRALIETKLRAALVAASQDPAYLVNVYTVKMTAVDDPEAVPRLKMTVTISTRMPAGVRLTTG